MIKSKKKIGCLIINWNGARDTIELLESLINIKCASSYELELLIGVIDNNSNSGDFDILHSHVKNMDLNYINILRNRINVGVPQAYNQAIQLVGIDCDHYLRLDNDVVLSEDGLDLLIAAIDELKGNAVGGNIKFYGERNKNNGGAVKIDLVRGLTTTSYPDHDCEVDGVLGCIVLVDGFIVREYFPNVFRSDLFLGTDESELSLRMKRDGYKTWYIHRVIGYHKSGVSTGKVGYTSSYYTARNWAILRIRYENSFLNIVCVFLSILWSCIKSLIIGRFYYISGTFSGFLRLLSDRFDKNALPNK